MSGPGYPSNLSAILNVVVTLGIFALMAWVSLAGIVPLTYDEAYNFQHFASKGATFVATNYSLPNNHILYSLLQALLLPDWLFDALPTAVRIPNLVVVAGLVSVSGFIAFRKTSHLTLLFLGILLFSPTVTLYFFVARGYLLGSLLIVGAIGYSVHRRYLESAILCALAAYCCPTYTFASIGLSIWILVQSHIVDRRKEFRGWILFSSASAAGTFLLYAPVIGDVLRNRSFGAPFPTFYRFARQLGVSMTAVGSLFESATIGWVSLACGFGLALSTVRLGEKADKWLVFGSALAFVSVASVIALVCACVGGAMPFPYIRSVHFIPFLLGASFLTFCISNRGASLSNIKELFSTCLVTFNSLASLYLISTSFGVRDPERFPHFDELSATPIEQSLRDGLVLNGELVVVTRWMVPVAEAYARKEKFRLGYIDRIPDEVPCIAGAIRPNNRKRDIYIPSRKGVLCY